MNSLLLAVMLSCIVQSLAQSCQEDILPAECASGAPKDIDRRCRQGVRNAGHREDFKDNWRVLWDTYDYTILYGFGGDMKTSASSQWIPYFGGSCTRSMYTCSYNNPSQSWLFSQFICLADAKELLFKVEYRFAQCRDRSACTNDFVTLHRYDVDSPASNADQTNTANYIPLGTEDNSKLQQLPAPVRLVKKTLNLNRPQPRRNGFHLGFYDSGTCGEITRMVVYYTVCEAKQVELVKYHEYANPPVSGPDEVFQTRCVCNAHPVTSLDVTAYRNGSCLDVAAGGARCECDNGYQISADRLSCKACPSGTYKATGVSSTCVPCPANTTTDAVAAGQCACLPGHFRSDSEGPDAACTAPPGPVTDLQAVGGTDSTVTLEWACPPGTGRVDLQYTVCYRNLDVLGNIRCDDPVSASAQCTHRYTIQGLDAFSTYHVFVHTSNGVSELDLENADRRVTEDIAETTEGVPNEPFLKDLCTVVIWKPPTRPLGIITSYELCFGSCGGNMGNCHTLGPTENFFVTSDQQRLDDVDVQIRVNNTLHASAWSQCRAIGCSNFQQCSVPPTLVATPPAPTTTRTLPPPAAVASTLPPPAPSTKPPTVASTLPPPAPSTASPSASTATPSAAPSTETQQACGVIEFSLGMTGTRLPAGSTVSLDEIGESNNALICYSPYQDCCKRQAKGEFYGPDEIKVGLKRDGGSLYRNRGDQFIRLNQRSSEGVATGEYECCVPDSCGNEVCAAITIA